MEEIKFLAERIRTNRDDLAAWHRLGELVDDLQKKRDCRNQMTRIQNQRCGVLHPIPCRQCGASMQVVPASREEPATAVCPECQLTILVEQGGEPAAGADPTGPRRGDLSMVTAWLNGQAALIAIVASNLLPIFGILFLGWSMGSVMLLYWFENVIVGFFALLKMALARGQSGSGRGGSRRIAPPGLLQPHSRAANLLSKVTILPFFCVHFGLFCLVHGVFVVGLFLPKGNTSRQWLELLASLVLPILGMLISHGTHFVQNYLRSGAYEYASIDKLMLEPYARIVPMHVGLIAAGFFIVALGSPMIVVVILVLLKTGAEVGVYRVSRKRRSATAP